VRYGLHHRQDGESIGSYTIRHNDNKLIRPYQTILCMMSSRLQCMIEECALLVHKSIFTVYITSPQCCGRMHSGISHH
jgi:hypothetical protein